MDDARVGRICRALRRRRGWRQVDLAVRAGCHQTTISAIERGHAATATIDLLRRVFGALDTSFEGVVGWRAGDLDRLVDGRHAATVEAVVSTLRRGGWSVTAEATYSEFGERGSIDVFASRERERAVAVFEIKTELSVIEATLRKHGEKTRLVHETLARRWLGWRPSAVGRILVFPEDQTIRRRLARHPATFATAYPCRSREVRNWLHYPEGALAGIWFLTSKSSGLCSRGRGGPRRVRRPPPGPS